MRMSHFLKVTVTWFKFYFIFANWFPFHSLLATLLWITGQVLLLHSQLQFERHRREVHAERNRRLLANAKGMRFLEEENHTLRLQLVQAQNEMAALRREADHLRRSRNTADNDKLNVVRQAELKTKQ